MEIEFNGEWAISASETEAGYLVIYSRTRKDFIDLARVEILEIKGAVSAFLKRSITLMQSVSPLDPLGMRSNLSSAWGAILTQHLLQVHHHLDRDSADVVSYTAWRYQTLTDWGEASAARELALDMNISVNTIRTRLQLARERGIIPAPGQGARFGR